MSTGLGRTQRRCLQAVQEHTARHAAGDEDRLPTTYTIAAEAYDVQRDAEGNRYVTDAQHVATKRALSGLRRKGLVFGQVDHIRGKLDENGWNTGNIERCCVWSTKPIELLD